jgi:Na+/proline symporter
MIQNWRDWRKWRDLFGGILLVLLLNGLLIYLISIGLKGSLGWLNLLLLACVGFVFIQFFYWIPIMLYFHRRRRFAVVNGISIGAIITILLWILLSWSEYRDGYADLTVVVIPSLLGAFTLAAFHYRSRPK